MVGPAFAGGHPGDPPGLDRAIAAQEAHTDALMATAGVVGTAVGLGANGRAVVLVFTERAGVARIPASLDGVTVVPRVAGKLVAFDDPTQRHNRPVPPGVSTGHPSITAGTIGARVTDGTNVYALSNNHVYADENNATVGDAVIQPGTFDGGSSPADDIGTLADFEPIVFSTSASNVIDAAIALSSTGALDNTTHCGWTSSSSTSAAELRMKVKKCGRTTGATDGRVTAINATVDIGYRTGVARFVKQIIVEPGKFSAGGDSGSLIVTKEGENPVALLFAGSFFVTIANPIDPVLSRFGVTIDDGAAPAPANDAPVVSISSPAAGGPDFDSGATVSFAGTASDTEDDNTTLTGSLAWSSSIDGSVGTGASFSAALSDGNHTITASVTDSGGKTGNASVGITVGTPPAEATKVSVSAVTYASEGGKNGDKHLLVTVALLDDLGSPVGGASVSTELENTTSGQLWTGTSTTGTGGTVTFTLKNFPSGAYTTTVTAVSAAGLIWDGVTPSNSLTK